MERLRRVLERNYAFASAHHQCPATPVDPKKPWDSVWRAAVDDTVYWDRQFEEQALLILTKSGRLSDVVTGEAPIEDFSSKPHSVCQPLNQTQQDEKLFDLANPTNFTKRRTVCTRTTAEVCKCALTGRLETVR